MLGQVGAGDLSTPDPGGAPEGKAKPRRLRGDATSWVMAVAHSDRGRLDSHARQAVAAAAILAQPSTGVVAVILGDFEEDAAALGADAVVVLPDLDADRFEPEREVAAVSSLIRAYDARHVFLPDKHESDGDLGRRLIVEHQEPAATHVVEIDAAHVCSPWSGAMLLARAPLPRFILLEAGAVDAGLPFAGLGERADTVEGPKVARGERRLSRSRARGAVRPGANTARGGGSHRGGRQRGAQRADARNPGAQRSARPSARAALPSTTGDFRATNRSARPARRFPRGATSRSAFPGPSSICKASRTVSMSSP